MCGDVYISHQLYVFKGWDGCRSRQDKRSDLENKLQYVKPLGTSIKCTQ